MKHLLGAPLKGELLALPAIGRLGSKGLPETSILNIFSCFNISNKVKIRSNF